MMHDDACPTPPTSPRAGLGSAPLVAGAPAPVIDDMKVLMSAYACEPGRGSEPGTGWAWASAAAERHDVTLLTRTIYRPAIEEALAARPDLRLHPVYLDLPRRLGWWQRENRHLRPYNLLWQVLAWRRGTALHRLEQFDVAHHVTWAIDWMPAGIAWVRGLPTVWGPVGGSSVTPPTLYRWLGARGMVEEVERHAVCRPLRRLLGDATARRAALTVAQNDDVERRFRRSARALVVEPNVALASNAAPAGDADRRQRHHAVFVGRLVEWKGLRLAIAAVARAPGWRLTVFGSGRDRDACEQAAQEQGVADRVHFAGNRPRTEVLRAVAAADALLFPSFHDSAPWAVGEAIMAHTRVVTLDLGGPPVLVRRTGGGTVVPSGGGDIAGRLAHALESGPPPGFDTEAIDVARVPALVSRWYEAVVAPTRRPRPAAAASTSTG